MRFAHPVDMLVLEDVAPPVAALRAISQDNFLLSSTTGLSRSVQEHLEMLTKEDCILEHNKWMSFEEMPAAHWDVLRSMEDESAENQCSVNTCLLYKLHA